MAEYIFIDENYLKDYTQLTDAVDPELMYPAALAAQDMYVQPYVGDALMRKLKTDAENDTLAGDYATLVNDYLRKPLVWWTMVELVDDLYVRWDNAAPQIRINDETNQIEQSDLKRARERCRSKAEYYTQRMVDWLCVNGSSMPEYNSNTAPDRSPTSAEVINQSGITFSTGRRNYPKYPSWAYDE